MIVGRAIGWILCIAAVAFLLRDVIISVVTGTYSPIITGQMWAAIDLGSLNLLQAIVQRYLSPWLWDSAIVVWLRWPAWISFGVLGLILVLVFRRWRFRRG